MWFEKFTRMSRKNKPIRNRSKKARSARPLVEPLETRELLAVFTPGNLIILQAGDGTPGQTTGALFLNEFTTSGTPIQSVALPNTQTVGGPGNQPITIDLSSAAGNGQLNRSYDGSVLSFAGLDANTGDPVEGGSARATGTADRVIAVAGNDPSANGFLDTTTHGQFYVGDDARGAILAGPTGPIYGIGHPNQAGGAVSQGVHFFPSTGPSIGTQVSASTNIRGATIAFDNRAYFSTAGITFQAGSGGGIFTDAQALPTEANANPAADIQVVPSLFSASKLGGIFFADVNGNGILSNGDRLYFLDDGTVGGSGSGGLYVATWDDTNTANIWNTPNNQAALAAGLTNHWSIPVRLGDAPLQDGGVGQLRGLTGTVISPTEVDLYTTSFDNVAGNISYLQKWVDTNPGLGIMNARVLSGTTVQITTLTPLPTGYTSGTIVQIDGVGATTGAGALTTGYNGAWSITVTGTNTFTYNDTNPGASGLGSVDNQGGADVTVNATTILSQANGSVTIGTGTHAAIAMRGVAFAPVAATNVSLDVDGSASETVSPGTNVTFNATLSNTQVGTAGLAGLTVTFIDQNTNTVIGSGIVGVVTPGVASFTTTTSLVGNHIVQAYFAGGGTNALPSARSGSVLVFEAGNSDSATTVSPNLPTAAIGRSVTLTATVTTAGLPAPSGTVSFYNGSGAIGNLLGTSILGGDGTASLTTSFSTAGTQTIVAVYNGDDTYQSSQNTTSVNVDVNATATVTSSANNVPLNSTPTYTVTINGNATLGTPNGTVVFHLVSATNLGTGGAPSVIANSSAISLTPGPNNTATALWSGTVLSAPGSYFITVTYTPTPANTTPYLTFATNTLNDKNGLAFIETVQQAFTPGNLIAVQRGDGNTNLGSNAYLTFLDEYTTGGVLVQKIALPNADSGATHALFTSGQTPAEGLLNRSADGYYLTLAGYDTPVGRTFVTSTFPYQYPRTIALVDGSANVDTSTAIGVLGSTGVAATISGASADSTSVGATVTITTSGAHNFVVGQQILISGIATDGYNGSVVITGIPDAMTFTYTDASAPADTTAVLGNTPTATPSSVPYNPVDVITNDGQEFWLFSTLNTGNITESGIQYITSVGASTAFDIGPAGNDGHAIAIAGGQLYISRDDNIQSVGANLPTTAGQTLSDLPNLQIAYDAAFPSPRPRVAVQFLFLNTTDGTSNSPNVVYIADQANGLLKFYKDGSGNWQFGASGTGSHAAGTFGQKLLFSGGVTGVVGFVQNPGPSADVQLYVTGVNIQGQNANQIAFFDDMGPFDNGFTNSANPNFATRALVGATGSPASPNGNMNFAGLAFAPGYRTSPILSASGSGASYTFTAEVSSAGGNTPTGAVLFYLDGVLQTQTASWTLDGSGTATYSTDSFPAGTHTVTAVYQGDVLDGTSTASVQVGSPPSPGPRPRTATPVTSTHTYATATVTPNQITITLPKENAPLGQLAVNTTAPVLPRRAGFMGDFDISAAGAPILATATTEFTGTVATFTDLVNFSGKADTPLEFQAAIDLGGATVPSVLDPFLDTYTVEL
jgi:hypothetical protein